MTLTEMLAEALHHPDVADGEPFDHMALAAAILAALPPDAVQAWEDGLALAALVEATKDDSGLALLHVPSGPRPDGRVLAQESGWTVERWPSVWGRKTTSGPTIAAAAREALG